jgi:hypothetical protein
VARSADFGSQRDGTETTHCQRDRMTEPIVDIEAGNGSSAVPA